MSWLATWLGVDPAWLVKAVFEANCLLLFFVCLAHSLTINGRTRTFREFSAGFILTALCESTGVFSGAYVYPGFQFYILATPVANPASWVALVYIIMTLSDRLVFGKKALQESQMPISQRTPLLLSKGLLATLFTLAFCDAVLALMLDLVLDPLATIFNWWIWVPVEPNVHVIEAGAVDAYNFDRQVWMTTPDNPIASFFAASFPDGMRYPTRVFGIPLINFVAWLTFVFVFTFQFRCVESRRQWSEWKKTWILWAVVLMDVPILGYLLIAPNL